MTDAVTTDAAGGGLVISTPVAGVLVVLLLALGGFVLFQNYQLNMTMKMVSLLADNCNVSSK